MSCLCGFVAQDRGEGDILLFINDLSSLADAKRFSNLICVSQFKALQSGIAQIETEIKEEMVNDLKRFRKEEQQRKERFEQQSRGESGSISISNRCPPLFNGASAVSSTSSGNPRNALFAAIRQRNVLEYPDDQEQQQYTKASTMENKKGEAKAPPHLALMEAIKKRQQPVAEPEVVSEGTQSAPRGQVNSQTANMGALKNRNQPSEQADGSSNGGMSSPTASRSALMAAIVKRQQPSADQERKSPADDGQQQQQHPDQVKPGNPRAALLSAIQKRNDSSSSSSGAAPASTQEPSASGGNSHTALLAAIRQRQDGSSGSPTSSDRAAQAPMNPQAALLAAIQRGRSKPQSPPGDGDADTNARQNGGAPVAEYMPREYTMESKFIADMRQRLLAIKSTYEDLEMELEAMNSAWEATARYLGEDPSGSSSEYIFNLLNRFRLDVKVVKSLLFRKGLSFASDLHALLPNACRCFVECGG